MSPHELRLHQPSSSRDEGLVALCDRAEREPLDIDVSAFSDEWCAGFLAGQVNALEVLIRKGYE